ncbi:hypothetical protein LU293_09510 [Moraxella nasovis]|uniref:hypothetical protein n=1 Tax=Moraxella nasovis TaxID=2904121 RepID=UPI001F61DCCC|nr:hypothetical protein [Moraxella nasovis]UNU73286.1 hypothetical protein LU293_09510 [Moraxella nasovis]
MTVNINDLHKCIDEMFININEQSSESQMRAYINRSYYAVFHELKMAMESVGIDINQYKTGTHNNLCLILDDMKNQNKSIQKLALQFRDFLTQRHNADYDLDKNITWHHVKVIMQYKQNLPSLIKEHIK